jgi:small conductance mechanosensitive channel
MPIAEAEEGPAEPSAEVAAPSAHSGPSSPQAEAALPIQQPSSGGSNARNK